MRFLFFLILLSIVSGCSLKSPSLWSNDATVCFASSCFEVELADDAEERRVWLMHRESLDENSGMLFVFEQPKPRITFWMKNTLIPLDMLRLDTSGHVLFIEQQVAPCTSDPCPTYGPKEASIVSKYVLELQAWKVEEVGISIWDRATIE